MEHYISNFTFERSRYKTNGRNYLVVHTITEKGPFGSVYLACPEFRFVSKNHYTLDRANELLERTKNDFNFSYIPSIHHDLDFNGYRIHFVGNSELAKHIEKKYKFKFLRQPQTEYVRTVFEGQHKKLEIMVEVEKAIIEQKKLNNKIRDFYSRFIMPIRSIKREYCISHKDAMLWISLKKKCKKEFVRKVIRNKSNFEKIWKIYEKDGNMSDEYLLENLNKIFENTKKKDSIERFFRILRTPAELLENKKGIDSVLQVIKEQNEELDELVKEVHEDNRS
ncbi:hypothetical protein KY312_03645, partial [Candidatus Woesearchaeota archaeon]|nr:hypothetical protein [Candidatus Woesearchaeota archaeon]